MPGKRKKWPLHISILAGLVAGLLWAFLAAEFGFRDFTLQWIDPFGVIFIRLLKLIALPLILFSIVSSLASLPDIRLIGRMGIKTFAMYLLTTVLAVSTGLALVNLLKPGEQLPEKQLITNRLAYETWVNQTPGIIKSDTFQFLLRPEYFDQKINAEAPSDSITKKLPSLQEADSPLQFFVDAIPDNIFGALSTNGSMLQIIFFAIFFGVALGLIPAVNRKPLLDIMLSANSVMMKMVDMVMKVAPFLVFALVAGTMCRTAENTKAMVQLFAGLGGYALTVLIGLFFLIGPVYFLILKFFSGHKNIKAFYKAISPAQLLAFSTCSTAATLPVTFECLDELKIPRQVSSFVLPIGATINMDGTSLYQAVAVIFLAQMHMVDLSLSQQLTIVLTATLASIGAASVPGSGIIMLLMVLQSVGLNPAWVAIILPVDRLLDMCRTVLNVTGDCVVASVVYGKNYRTKILPDTIPTST